MKTYNSNAYTQAYVMTNFLVETGEIVISENLIDTIENRMNKNYYFDLNDIKQAEIMEDTEKILTQVYLECMVDEKEKTKITKLSNQLQNLILEEEELKENQALLPVKSNDLSFFEKLKITFNKLNTIFGKADKKENTTCN